MSFKRKLLIRCLLSILFSAGGISSIVAIQADKDSLARHAASSRSELLRVNDYLRALFEEAQANALYVARLPQTGAALRHLTDYLRKTGEILLSRKEMTPE